MAEQREFDQKNKDGLAEAFVPKYGEPYAFGYTADVFKTGSSVLKVFSKEFTKDLIFREAYIGAAVESTELSVAKILGVRTEEGFWVIESEFIEGTDLLKDIFGASMTGDAAGVQEVIRQTARLQAKMNACEVAALPSYKEYARVRIANNDAISAACREKTLAYLADLPEGNKLCHGDFHPQNVLKSPQGELFIIDWVEAGYAPAACDAARTYMNLKHLPPVPPLQNPAFRMADVFMETYTQKTGIREEEITAWLPVHAAINYGEKAPWYSEAIKGYLL